MTTATSQLFSRAENNTGDEEQLLKLFWNRAELKKELDKLRNENYTLTDQLKQETAVKLRVQQRLDQLETILANPDVATSAIAYYQLKHIWNLCHDRLVSIASSLEKNRHDAEYRLHIAGFRRKLYKSLTSIQRELNDVNQNGEVLRARILKLREQRVRCSGFWLFFKRRRLTAEINTMRVERRSVTMQLGELTEEIQSRSSVEPPEFDGLQVADKRMINLTVIAFAQEYYLHFADHDLAAKALEASVRQVADVRYGGKRDCRSIAMYAEEGVASLAADADLRAQVDLRLKHLEATVSYRREADTIPAVESVDAIQTFRNDGKLRGTVSVNVLLDEYWDLFTVLRT